MFSCVFFFYLEQPITGETQVYICIRLFLNLGSRQMYRRRHAAVTGGGPLDTRKQRHKRRSEEGRLEGNASGGTRDLTASA